MKSLFIFILCVSFCVSSAFGQLIVRGDIKVSNTPTGLIRANTPVILKDSVGTDYPRGIITNAGTLSLGGSASLVFCSNDRTDGMIVPQTGATNVLADFPASGSTFVYKNFANQRDIWLPMSFPFDVNVADILSANSFLTEDNFAIIEYNSQSRADHGLFQNVNHWNYVANNAVLAKGKGYRIILTSDYTSGYTVGDSIVVFPAASGSNINSLLSYTNKGTTSGLIQSYTGAANELNWGWNYIGGLNPCAYNMSGAANFQWNGTAANWNGAIYYMTLLPDTILWDEQITGQDSIVVSPFVSFFVQVEEANSFTFNTSGIASYTTYPVNFRSADDQSGKQVLYLKLSDSENRFDDRLYIYLENQYREDYVIEEDGQKLLFAGHDPRIRVWSMQGDVPLVVNAVPPKDGREIPIGFSVPGIGRYTFTLEDRTGEMKSVELTDNQTGETVDLLSKPYTFNVNMPESTNERFVLVLNKKSGTDIVPVNASDIYAYIADSRLTVGNLQTGDRVQVIDLTGRLVASGISQGKKYSLPMLRKGIYVICVKGDRNAVLKVLNP